MTTHATEPPTRRTLSWQVRAGIGLAVGVAIVFALLRLVSADNSLTRMLDSAHRARLGRARDRVRRNRLLRAPAAPRAHSGTHSGADAHRRPGTVAAIGIGNLVPGQPAPETAICDGELQRRGASRSQSLAVPLVLLVTIPSVAMILLAGPTLLISGVTITLRGAGASR
jgi:hypothetical protein